MRKLSFSTIRKRQDKKMGVLIKIAEQFMVDHMANYDPSHDSLHIFRVRKMALKLCENVGGDLLIVELAALFHDLIDHKYANDVKQVESSLISLMRENGLAEDQIGLVLKIVKNVGFSVENRLKKSGEWTEWHENCVELHCVNDADRLDAIGAIGVYRAAAYSSAKNNPLFEKGNDRTAHQHFHDKLLILKNTMKTELGKKVAEKRTKVMDYVVGCAEDEAELADF